MDFISKDKKTINLPVPLGTIVYCVSTSCNDACLFQKEEFEKAFPSVEGGRCSMTMPCHTKIHNISPEELKLGNIEWVLKNWGFRYFETEEEARRVTEARLVQHAIKMSELGLTV